MSYRPLTPPARRMRDVRWLFHVTAAAYFARVWMWHVSSESIHREGRKRFGGYFCYLTICSFTVQLVQLIATALVDLSPHGKRQKLKKFVDDISCAVFVLANCVTMLYYAIECLTPGGIVARPHEVLQWIDKSTHILNSIVAWIDILTCHPRSFSARSYGLTALLAFCYGCWICVIKLKTGNFPYGFLNKLPHPHGLLLMTAVSAVLMSLIFLLGKGVSRLGKSIIPDGHIEDVHSSSADNKANSSSVAPYSQPANGVKED